MDINQIKRVILSHLIRVGDNIPDAVSMKELLRLKGEAFRKGIDPAYKDFTERVEIERRTYSRGDPLDSPYVFIKENKVWFRLGIYKHEFDSFVEKNPGYSHQMYQACKTALFNRIRKYTEDLFSGYLYVDSFGKDSEYCIGSFNKENIEKWKPDILNNFIEKVQKHTRKIFTQEEAKRILENYKDRK